MKKGYKNLEEARHKIHLVRAKQIKTIIIALFLFLVVPLITSQDLVIPFNEKYDIKRPCFNNGTFCTTAATCNFTIIRPNGNTLLTNRIMTFNNNFFNITILKDQNNVLGSHPSIMSCCEGGLCNADTFDIVVTADGNPIQIFPTQFGIILFGFLLVGFGTLFERLRLFKHTGAIMLLVMGVVTLFPGYSLINHSNLAGQSVGFVTIGLGFWFLIEDSFSRDIQDERYMQDDEGVLK